MCLDGGQLLTVSQLRVRAKEPDEACAQATDLARGAAEEVAGAGRVGVHVGIQADGDRVVTHLFNCLDQAYQGWRWAITLARASWSKTVTVSESVLIPGPEAILAPDWVPWRERLLPGDLGVGDILPAPPDDERLVPVAVLEGDDGVADWGEATWAAAPFTEPVELPAGEDPAGEEGPQPRGGPPSSRRASSRLGNSRLKTRCLPGPVSCPRSGGTPPRRAGTPASTGRRRRSRMPPQVLVLAAGSSSGWPVRSGRCSACAPTPTRRTTAGWSR